MISSGLSASDKRYARILGHFHYDRRRAGDGTNQGRFPFAAANGVAAPLRLLFVLAVTSLPRRTL